LNKVGAKNTPNAQLQSTPISEFKQIKPSLKDETEETISTEINLFAKPLFDAKTRKLIIEKRECKSPSGPKK
jgi:hypothetical protein